MAARRDAHVGTSGWVHPHWKGAFHPEDLPQHARLAYYAELLRSVEVNSTYYRLPSQHALQVWRETVPEDFTFAVKRHRHVTHRQRLLGVEDSLDIFFESLQPIEDRVGIVLFQLPPFLGYDPQRLDDFLALLPEGCHRYAMEFRHPGWHHEQTWEILRLHDIAFCVHDFGMEPEIETTSDDVYVRLHGPDRPYAGLYDEAPCTPGPSACAPGRAKTSASGSASTTTRPRTPCATRGSSRGCWGRRRRRRAMRGRARRRRDAGCLPSCASGTRRRGCFRWSLRRTRRGRH